ncbi:MAG TPA: hypothetical protein VLG76_03625 [Rhabdochlamydiaceae bacterium]|nr:hypothetical protein [Rhabdochlamydiaceae bacterium]
MFILVKDSIIEVKLKFQTIEAFEKHLKEVLPAHPANIYLIVSGQDFERKKWMEDIFLALQKKGPCDLKYAAKVQDALLHLRIPSLLGGTPIACLDEVDELCDEALIEYAVQPAPFSYLILGASNFKPLADLYDKAKKEIIIFDFSGEKPWQREKRMKKSLAAKVFKEGKTITPALIDLLFGELPLELGIIEQELSKLICYVGERKEIKLEDLQAISCRSKTKEGWQIADELVWGSKIVDPKDELDATSLFVLIGQIRFYLEKGLMIATLVEKGKSLQEIADGYPEISNSVLQKFAAKPKKTLFFKKGVMLLFELELAAKSGSTSTRLLFDIFSTKLIGAG